MDFNAGIDSNNKIQELNKKCLIDELAKLKESSKEAVEGLNSFSDFKKYMHIERNVQSKLEELIINVSKSDNSQLILVCGSVGDGKSHLISYFKDKYPEVISKFKLHNDATESLEPNQTSMDTLNNVLDEFSDEKIDLSNQKFILAINLGTLNNFIDSKYGSRFTKLKQYVDKNKILEQAIVENDFDPGSNIQFVNFCDYHIYTIEYGKIKSKYIKDLLGKLTNKSDLNCFYKSYKENCTNCSIAKACPIKVNYELLSDDDIQKSIVELLVQVIIKNKIIISTRALLNFLHDILISRTYIDINSPMFKKKIEGLKAKEYIDSLMPNILFSHKELSPIFEGLNKLDPLNMRTEALDDFVIKFNNSTNLIELFDENIDYPSAFLGNINTETEIINKVKVDLLKLFIRSYLLYGKNDLFSLKDDIYYEFVTNLYYWNKGEKAKLKDLYRFIKNGILKWNGEADKDSINIFIGKNQNKYKVSEEIEFKADISNLPSNKDNELIKFLNTMEIKFKSNRLEVSEIIDVDYSLYKLLKKVNDGYRPNKKDKNQFVKFVEFINKLDAAGSQDESLLFTEKNRDNNKKYRLQYDDEFEMYRFVEI
ncbi:DNA phosphorothioation-dependent restriction protein DptF [Clostridium sp.]|uniref:DNA phosphorothioation-dependent restriction protein DptF n=1 Tax=Clostridium sp. TaxID=1506 RepID=UPI002608B90A